MMTLLRSWLAFTPLFIVACDPPVAAAPTACLEHELQPKDACEDAPSTGSRPPATDSPGLHTTVTSQLPETRLSDIALPKSVPGRLSLTVSSESTMTASLDASCGPDESSVAYRGNIVAQGSITIVPTVELEMPGVGMRSFELAPVTVPVSDMTVAMDG